MNEKFDKNKYILEKYKQRELVILIYLVNTIINFRWLLAQNSARYFKYLKNLFFLRRDKVKKLQNNLLIVIINHRDIWKYLIIILNF